MRRINHTSKFRTVSRFAVRTLTIVAALSAIIFSFPAAAQDAQPDAGKAAPEESSSATEVTPLEGMVVLSPGLVLLGSLGYVEPDYTKVKFDLTRDGKLDSKDEDLEPPRAAHWTYSLGLLHNLRVGTRVRLASRFTYAYRDKEYTNDDNTGFNRQQKMLQAGVDMHIDNSQWVVGLYGKNLLDYARFGTDIQLPTGTLSPLMRGRVFGLELTYHFTGD